MCSNNSGLSSLPSSGTLPGKFLKVLSPMMESTDIVGQISVSATKDTFPRAIPSNDFNTPSRPNVPKLDESEPLSSSTPLSARRVVERCTTEQSTYISETLSLDLPEPTRSDGECSSNQYFNPNPIKHWIAHNRPAAISNAPIVAKRVIHTSMTTRKNQRRKDKVPMEHEVIPFPASKKVTGEISSVKAKILDSGLTIEVS